MIRMASMPAFRWTWNWNSARNKPRNTQGGESQPKQTGNFTEQGRHNAEKPQPKKASQGFEPQNTQSGIHGRERP